MIVFQLKALAAGPNGLIELLSTGSSLHLAFDRASGTNRRKMGMQCHGRANIQ